MWERACPANTGEARAIHLAACFAGTPAPTATAYAFIVAATILQSH
ncbi:diguanylate cyclase [Pseudomonas sp. FW306-2-2C-D06B]|nr:diguanylate cyclase [Pseudomonas sp. FW306-2-2C-D06B]